MDLEVSSQMVCFFFWNSFNPWLIGWWKVEKSGKGLQYLPSKTIFPSEDVSMLHTILLMEEILLYPANHLGCKKNIVNDGINYQPQLVSTDFFHQQQSRHLQLDSKWWMSPSPPWQQKTEMVLFLIWKTPMQYIICIYSIYSCSLHTYYIKCDVSYVACLQNGQFPQKYAR